MTTKDLGKQTSQTPKHDKEGYWNGLKDKPASWWASLHLMMSGLLSEQEKYLEQLRQQSQMEDEETKDSEPTEHAEKEQWEAIVRRFRTWARCAPKELLIRLMEEIIQLIKESEMSNTSSSKADTYDPIADPELQLAAAKLTVKLVKAGVLNFANFIDMAVENLGRELVERIGPLLENAWAHIYKNYEPEGMTPAGSVAKMLEETKPRKPSRQPPFPSCQPGGCQIEAAPELAKSFDNVISAKQKKRRKAARKKRRPRPTADSEMTWEHLTILAIVERMEKEGLNPDARASEVPPIPPDLLVLLSRT